MNILAWNVQGLGNDWTFRILHDYVQQYSHSLVFLSETLSSKAQMERVRSKLGYSGMLTWEREGRSGELCLLWSDSITVQLLSGSKGHIDVMVTSLNSICWHFTGLYGNPDTSLRSHSWNLMKRLGDSSSLPWLCGGDLNEILFGHEKQGGAERAQYLMSHFREAINYCELADLGFRGPKFTWKRGNGAGLVQERLDRMLGNSRWLDLFPNSLVHHLNLRGSDHRPLLVELLQADERSIIDLEGWNLESFSRLKMQVRKAKTAFDRIDKNLSCHNWKEHQRLEKALDALRYKEERYWRQRSKDSWLKCGDRNSKFFHQKASARKIKNSINGLVDSNEKWCDEEEGMAHIIENYFDTLFSSSSPSSVDFDRVLDSIERKVTPQQNEQLEQAFVAKDVKTAVFQMAPTKSPGADGMSAIFYQKFWRIVGEEVTAACLGFTNGGLSLGSINETIITLLPKIKNPTRITEFRPISLCNVLYKIISKMLANRLRRIMGTIISEEQSTFIPGRLISDNAIIGFECLHAIKRRKTKKNYLALKLDMAKAYDRVEWDFIQRVMNKLGFSEVWIRKIMACISSVTYSFQFNGKRFGHLAPTRGLHQGDPLSPYLFLLCGEGLSSLLHLYEQKGDIQGLRCGLRGPTISHLLFADDSLFFLEARLSTCANLKEILKLYETASGQVVNLSKSAMCFGPNLSEPDATQMAALLGVPKVRCHEKYLGLPCFSGRNKQGLFSSIRDRVRNKLCGWKSKLLSVSGREILSKSVIQAIPTYAMNLFKLPSTLIRELHRLCAQFWWGGESGKRRMHCILWGHELYKQGLRCKIGSGQNTYIYHDCWLPRDGIFKISSPRMLGDFAKVSSLITALGSWDSSIIRKSFPEDEAEAILSLPLPRQTTPDTLLWHYDKSGHYTVRSGYWLANKCRSVPSSSTISLNAWFKTFLHKRRKGDPSKKVVASPWQPPKVGFVKVNSDAAWCSNKKKFGLGSIIRDYSGKVLGSLAMSISSSVSVAVAESWALEKGASLAKQMGFSAVILESDCLGVTKALDTKTLHDSDISYVFDSIYEICNGFDMYNFSYIPRTGNQVAHSLARLALSLENIQLWPSGVPESLTPLVSADIQHVSSS
ncbi:hypothetical protein UlMin_020374 [Ulmus minor]